VHCFQDYLFATVNKADLIIYSKNNGTKLKEIDKEASEQYQATYGVSVSAPSKQQPIESKLVYQRYLNNNYKRVS
jgi:hypothetical protein